MYVLAGKGRRNGGGLGRRKRILQLLHSPRRNPPAAHRPLASGDPTNAPRGALVRHPVTSAHLSSGKGAPAARRSAREHASSVRRGQTSIARLSGLQSKWKRGRGSSCLRSNPANARGEEPRAAVRTAQRTPPAPVQPSLHPPIGLWFVQPVNHHINQYLKVQSHTMAAFTWLGTAHSPCSGGR